MFLEWIVEKLTRKAQERAKAEFKETLLAPDYREGLVTEALKQIYSKEDVKNEVLSEVALGLVASIGDSPELQKGLFSAFQSYIENTFPKDKSSKEIVINPSFSQTTVDSPHPQLDTVLKAIACGNVSLIGPAGSGKTTLAKQVATALDLSFYFNGAIDSEYKLSGYKDATGTYHTTAFREAFEKGGVYLFDEIDASGPRALLAFNAALANGNESFPDRQVEKHKDFRCIAAANTYGRGANRVYVGRNQLDGATLDRFITVDMDYDPLFEFKISANANWTSRVQAYREACKAVRCKTYYIL